jgi:hypothetical protein
VKYIIYDDDLKNFIIFPDYNNHSDMFDKSKKLLSAGKCTFYANLDNDSKDEICINAIAESISLGFELNCKQSEQDSEYLTTMINIFK